MFGSKVLSFLNRYIIVIVFALALSACSQPLEKSVIEPLTSKELDKVVRKDKSFLTTYSIVEGMSNNIHTSADSARWILLSYSRLHDYLKTTEGVQLNTSLVSKLREEWENMYNDYVVDADSLINYWRDYLFVNSYDSLVNITFNGIEIERFKNKNNEIDTLLKVMIKFIPLKFSIDSISANYTFVSSKDTLHSEHPDSAITVNMLNIQKKISDSLLIKVYPELSKHIKTKLIAKDSNVVFNYNVLSLYSNGKSYNPDDLIDDMPKSVQAYFIASSNDDKYGPVFDETFYIENIIRELVNPSFISQTAYIKVNSERFYKEIDSLAFNFVNYKALK